MIYVYIFQAHLSFRLKKDRKGFTNGTKDFNQYLLNKVVALLFKKPSTRTRFSFEVGIFQMGGKTISVSSNELQISNLETMPKGILLWRAILQWLGGIGIIVMAITLMPIMNVGGMQLFKISNTDSSEKILPKSKEIAIRSVSYTHLTLPTIYSV